MSVSERGLTATKVIGHVHEAVQIPWSHVTRVDVTDAVGSVDDPPLKILEIESVGGGPSDELQVQRFVATEAAAAKFLTAVSAHRPTIPEAVSDADVVSESDPVPAGGSVSGALAVPDLEAVSAGAAVSDAEVVAERRVGFGARYAAGLATVSGVATKGVVSLHSLVARASRVPRLARRTFTLPSTLPWTGASLAGAVNPAGEHAEGSGAADGGSVGSTTPGRHRRLEPIAVGFAALLLLAGSSATFEIQAGGAAPRHVLTSDVGNKAQAEVDAHSTHLPAATSKPKPAPPNLADSAPLRPHEIFGYAPYWTLPQSSGFDVKDLTTLAYFSVDVNGNGTLDESGSGWNGYESQDLVNLVNRSHAAGDRVVLTVTDFDQASLDAITSNPSASATLSAALITAIAAKNLDGVNFDFEGEGSGDQKGLTRLITNVSHTLHAANPHWQVTMAVYASSAGDPDGFYNIRALAPAVDGFFVMAYDMNDRSNPSPTAPLAGGGFNDTQALQQFTAAVPRQKVILGVPFYGYDWSTNGGTLGAQATGGESPLSDSVIASSGHPTYWDPATQTAWTSYQVGTQWHETFFDDPTSLALKARLANSFRIAGLGIWALGMDGNNPAMMAALLGNAPAVKDFQTGPTTTSTTTPPGSAAAAAAAAAAASSATTYQTTGVWNGQQITLTPLTNTNATSAQYLGTLTGFTTTDPTLSCLQGGPALDVWSFSNLPGVDVVVASQPTDCAAAMWTFSSSGTSGTTGGSGGSGSTTTTTVPKKTPPTTTTTTTVPPTTTTTVPPTTTTTVPPTTTTTTTTVPPTTTTPAPASTDASSTEASSAATTSTFP